MSALPWIKLYTELPTHRKSVLLAVETGDRRAWTYVAHLMLWAGKNAGDGHIRGANAAGLIEMAVEWTGAPGKLVAGMVTAGFLEQTEDGYRIHDWATEQGAHVAKMERDRKKPDGKRSRAAPARETGGSSENPARDVGGIREGASPLSTLSSSQEGCGEEPPKSKPAWLTASPVKPGLPDALDAAFREAKGAEYERSYADENALGRLLAQGERSNPQDPAAEVLRRWRIALAWVGYPSCSTWLELSKLWNHFAKAQPAPGKPADPTRGVVRAEAAKHAPVGRLEDF